MKKGWIIGGVIIVVLIIVAIVLGITQPWKPGEPEVIKIGAILPLTGDAAEYGKNGQMGIDLAVEEINDEGGINGKLVEIIYEDSKADPKEGVVAFNKLNDIDQVPIIIGPFASSVTLAVAPVAEEKRVVLLSPVSSAPAITDAGDYIFRNSTTDEYEGPVMANYAMKELGYTKFATFTINNDYGQGLAKVFADTVTANGGKILIQETFEPSSTDFKTQLLKIKEEEPQALYIIGQKEVPNILIDMQELDFTSPQIISSVMFEDPDNIEKAPDIAEGVIYSFPSFDPLEGDDVAKDFGAGFEKKYRKTPEIFAALSYDAAKITALAIKKGGYDSDGIKEALYKISDFPGVCGNTTFDENGDVDKPIGVKTVKDAKFSWLVYSYE
jgi:branched-chain amino acid transport system substrate-binding protein